MTDLARYSETKRLLFSYTGMHWRKKDRPLLREFVLFYVDGMELGEDGRYHLDFSQGNRLLTRREVKSPHVPWNSSRSTALTVLLPEAGGAGFTVMIGTGAGGYRSQYETSTACENPQVLRRYGRTRAMADGWQMLHSEPQRKTPDLSGSRRKRSVSVCRHRGIAPEFRRTHPSIPMRATRFHRRIP